MAGTTSSFRYLMNSGISFSRRSAASPMVLPTRAEASSTLRLKSFMVLLAINRREWVHAVVRMPGSPIISRWRGAVNGWAGTGQLGLVGFVDELSCGKLSQQFADCLLE